MRFLEILVGACAAVSTVLAAPAGEATVSSGVRKRQSKFQWSGINESGAEFGSTAIPGQLNKDYIWPSKSTIDTMVGKGFNIFRIPFMMERLIPSQMTGSINETYYSGLSDIVNYITSKGAYAVVDPHNFGRYYNTIISNPTSFQTFWHTLASRLAANPLVVFDTNNEYHDMDNTLVAQLNQAAITGIRSAGATTQYIFVEGNSYTGAWTWVSSGNGANLLALTDPQDKLVYEMHQYLDTDGSGTSASCVNATIGRDRLVAATQWLEQNGKRAVLGEMAGGANAVCVQAVTGMLEYMEAHSGAWIGWLWWGGGPWWGDYIYGMEPPSGTAYTGVLPSIMQFV